MAQGREWMPFYVADWYQSIDIQLMTPEAESCYRVLLDKAWTSEDGGLPDDDDAIKTLLGKYAQWWDKSKDSVRKKFESRDGKLFNKRLSEELSKVSGIAKSRKKAAKTRWSKESQSDAMQGVAGMMPCKGGEWPLYHSFIQELERLYEKPGDTGWVFEECRKAKAWLISNPARQKTARGMPRFINGWIKRAADAGDGRQAARLFAASEADQQQKRKEGARNGSGSPIGIGEVLDGFELN